MIDRHQQAWEQVAGEGDWEEAERLQRLAEEEFQQDGTAPNAAPETPPFPTSVLDLLLTNRDT